LTAFLLVSIEMYIKGKADLAKYDSTYLYVT